MNSRAEIDGRKTCATPSADRRLLLMRAARTALVYVGKSWSTETVYSRQLGVVIHYSSSLPQ